MNKIESNSDLPEYGKFVLVYGKDESTYGEFQFHVCEMNDLEDGLDFQEKGEVYWLTEAGKKIEDVQYWQELPARPF